jgi:uncharacterized membrane protein YeaQ/YmgE (transglycosylase-associated protein family)
MIELIGFLLIGLIAGWVATHYNGPQISDR